MASMMMVSTSCATAKIAAGSRSPSVAAIQIEGGRQSHPAPCRPLQPLCDVKGRSTAIPSAAAASAAAAAVWQKPSRRQVQACGTEYVGAVTAQPGWKFGVVVARFNSLVTKQLLEGAQETFARHGVPAANIDVAWVPGSFELPVVAKSMAASGSYHAVVCIGAVIQGATAHFDAVVSAATGGVLSAGTATGVPVVFGVLTTDTLEQALDRAGGKLGNKGAEFAATAIEMASLMSQLQAAGKAAPPGSSAP